MLGRLAGGLAGGMLSEGARQLSQGQRPSVGDLLLTPANARRLAERLSEMRGAAMKVGQLLSMDSGNLVPAPLSEVLARLREDAHPMPLGQVAKVLNRAWGADWERDFRRFMFTPIAAASIGQVHEALLRDGRRLAIKIQYPGIRQSIDSDVDNVAALLGMFQVVPAGLNVRPLLDEAKRQLHREADYRAEAAALQQFRRKLGDDPRYRVPGVIEDLSTEDVLAMHFQDGRPIESLADESGTVRNRAAGALVELALREVFDWGLVQTDPNFANYLYDPLSASIQLLDFGATRAYPAQRREALHSLLAACVEDDQNGIAEAAHQVGYLGDDDPPGYPGTVVRLLRTATEPVRSRTPFRFRQSDLAQRMGDIVVEMRLREKYGRLPPTDILFLHRKLGGLYLLLTRIDATVTVHELIDRYLPAAAATLSGEAGATAG
jgi:predicted unusual protein kinase regulating ubiquinone biosynthesis (AarF/ABC1/UbiB family)